jgi:hypothetical protein
MKKSTFLLAMMLSATGCSVISEMTAFKKCEFSFRSLQDPVVCGIDIGEKSSFAEFSFREGQEITMQLLQGTFPFEITANVEVMNPGSARAAVSSIQWIALIDEMQVSQGIVNDRVEVAPNGGRALIPLRIHADLFDFLEGDNPRTMFNFVLNLIHAGDQPTRMSLKIKPSVLIGQQSIAYPGYFTLTEEFGSGD